MKRLLALAAGLSLLLAGCGITPGPVRTEGKRGGPGQLGSEAEMQDDLRRPENIDNARVLVQQFLEAAANSETADPVKTTGTYLKPGESWLPSTEVRLVRPLAEPTTSSQSASLTSVVWRVRHVGKLSPATGMIQPIQPTDAREEELRFTVENVPGKGVYLVAPPQFLYLNDMVLDKYFERRTIFFWSATGDTLVPDVRYVSRYRPEVGRADQLVKWLYEGPSPWLDQAVLRPPGETEPPAGKSVTRRDDGAFVVDLGTSVEAKEMERLTTQLAKTLLLAIGSVLEVTVKSRPLDTYRWQPDLLSAYRTFGIVDGAVRRIEGSLSEPLRLPPAHNKNLTAVAFSRDEGSAMLAHKDGEYVKLSIWSHPDTITPVTLPRQPRRVSQPIWLADERSLLVLADLTLYQVGIDGSVTPVVNGTNLTAVSLGADKTRLALVQDGQLKVAALHRGNNALSIGRSQIVPTQFVKGVHNATFLGPAQLVVAGANDTSVTLVSINVDGGAEYSYGGEPIGLGSNITHLVAKQPAGPVYFEVDGRPAYGVERGAGWEQLQAPQVSSPPPSASPSSAPQIAWVYRPSIAG